jgi:hypothetical protein
LYAFFYASPAYNPTFFELVNPTGPPPAFDASFYFLRKYCIDFFYFIIFHKEKIAAKIYFVNTLLYFIKHLVVYFTSKGAKINGTENMY